jgi:hypothetical protein
MPRDGNGLGKEKSKKGLGRSSLSFLIYGVAGICRRIIKCSIHSGVFKLHSQAPSPQASITQQLTRIVIIHILIILGSFYCSVSDPDSLIPDPYPDPAFFRLYTKHDPGF